jgi:hypothetical protein
MTTPDVSFLVAPCGACDRTVLTARDLDADHRVVVVCVHCAERLDPDEGRYVAADDLDAMGYILENTGEPHGERGCRDGACGVRQPETGGGS